MQLFFSLFVCCNYLFVYCIEWFVALVAWVVWVVLIDTEVVIQCHFLQKLKKREKLFIISSNTWKVGYYGTGLCRRRKNMQNPLQFCRYQGILKFKNPTDIRRRHKFHCTENIFTWNYLIRLWSRVSWRATWLASAATATSQERGNYVAVPSHAVSHSRFHSR